MSKKQFRELNYKEIEHCLCDWFCDKIPISGPMLCSKAADFAALLQIDFKPNSGWLQRFKDRHNITRHKISGEKEDVNVDVVHEWKEKILPSLTKDYDAGSIYNCDETALFYRFLSEYTLDHVGESTFGSKKSKGRITGNIEKMESLN